MKNIIKSIQKIKGVTEVVPTQMNMAIVVFEPQNEPILITEDGVPLFNEDDECWWVNPNSMKKGKQLSVFSELENDEFKYFSTKKAAKEFISMQSTCAELHELIEKESIKPISVDLGHLDIFDTLALHAHMSAEKKEKSEPKPEAIKCDTKEQLDFFGIKYKGEKFCNVFKANKYDCANIETDGSGACACHEGFYIENGYTITPFSTFISRESLTSEWEKFLIAEAVKRGFVKGVRHKGYPMGKISGEFEIIKDLYFGVTRNIFGGSSGCIYNQEDGKWAEIIPSTPAEPKPLIADQLKDGEVYTSKETEDTYIFRFKSFKAIVSNDYRVNYYSLLSNDTYFAKDWMAATTPNRVCRPATLSEAQSLIRAEFANNYFHGLTATE